MNRDEPRAESASSSESELLAELIRSAGRRADPPQSAYLRSLEAATEAWQRKLDRARRRRTTRVATAAAASAAILSLLLALPEQEAPPAVHVATLDRVIGTLEIRSPGRAGWQLYRDDAAQLRAGARLRTAADGRAALLLSHGASLRLAERTDVLLVGPASVELLAGKAYVDSGGQLQAGVAVQIVTRAATATEVGTQFEVALDGQQYRLRVREGRVILRHGGKRDDGRAGEQLAIDATGRLKRTAIRPTDQVWQWVESVASAPDLNEQPVSALLAWVARETGRPIRYSDSEVERRAAATILHGSVRHLAPLEALGVMLATTNLEYVELADGTLLIQSRPSR